MSQLFVLLLLAGSGVGTSEGERPPKKDALIERWEAWAVQVDNRFGVHITYHRRLNDPESRKPWTSELKKDGDFAKRTGTSFVYGSKYSYVTIANGSYVANMQKKGGEYILQKLAPFGSEQASAIKDSLIVSKHVSPVRQVRRDWIKDTEPLKVEKLEGDRWKFVFESRNPSEASYEVVVSQKYGWLPVESISVDKNHSRGIAQYHYKNVEGVWLWHKTESYSVEEGNRELRRIVEPDYDAVSDDLDHNECYLSFYGLREPEFASQGSRRAIYLVLWLVVGGLLVVGSCYYLFRRSKARK